MRCPTLLTDQGWMPELTEANHDLSFESDTRATRPFDGEKVMSTLQANRRSSNPAAGAPMVQN